MIKNQRVLIPNDTHPLRINRNLARLLENNDATILLSVILEELCNKEGQIYMEDKELELKTFMTPSERRKALKLLTGLKIIRVINALKPKSGSYYRIRRSALRDFNRSSCLNATNEKTQ